jgi:catalase (peroxidase I)
VQLTWIFRCLESFAFRRWVGEVYASDDAQEKFVNDFIAARDKVMNLDRGTRR